MYKNRTGNAQVERPNCFECTHFYITWESSKPYGCRAMNFKSRRIPTVEVLDADGALCVSFQGKNGEGSSTDSPSSIKILGANLSLEAQMVEN